MNLFYELLDALDLKRLSENRFEGRNVNIGSPNIYGGHVLSQAARAAILCEIDGKKIHSLHGYFLHPGNNDLPILYEVEQIKRGRSFDVMRVVASQKEKTIFIMSASFHLGEEGIRHQYPMPNAVSPDQLQPYSKIFKDFADKFGIQARGILSAEGPFIFHPLEYYDPFNPGIRPPKQHLWFKINGDLPADRPYHAELLAYISDFNLLITALLPHNLSFFTTPMKIASLDHAMWFHSDFDIRGWMLYEVESPAAANGRAFCTGKIFTAQGNLIASVTQEGLIRKM
ncbi:MAG: acyl-CoA thioesterase II [Saprospiraceae bacterium]|nr:acyl-CoA thioesterase II [Saprospiraceae bacterium]